MRKLACGLPAAVGVLVWAGSGPAQTGLPETTITTAPPATVSVPRADFAFTGGPGFLCSLDGEVPVTCGSPVVYRGLAEGRHVFEVSSVSAEGAVDPTPARAVWTVDLPPPPLTPFDLSGPIVSRWAPVVRAAKVRIRPSASARTIARLGIRTPEGTTNLVLALTRVEDRTGRLWVRVRLPILPNNSTGWVRRGALGGYTSVPTRLVVDRARLRAVLYRWGRPVWRARIGVGAPGSPTPRGEFYVRVKLRGFADPFYGPLAFGLNARSAVLTDWPGGGFIGIHGTNLPWLLPGRVSNGCVRLRNEDILRLAPLLPIGTPVSVR